MNEAETAPGLGEIVEDRLLDGRLILRQPRKGHRAGSDAILLAASLPELDGGALLDIGAGVGTVGLAVACLRPGLRATLLERDPELAVLASGNAELNGLAGRVDVGPVQQTHVDDADALLTTAGVVDVGQPLADGGVDGRDPGQRRHGNQSRAGAPRA